MIRSIRRNVEGAPRPERTPLERLTSCHVRIRQFLRTAQQVAAREGSPGERRAAAEQCTRYFTEAFPLHARDEDQAVLPYLVSIGVDTRARERFERLQAEHGRDEDDVKEMATMLRSLAADGETDALLDSLAARLSSLAPRLLDHLAFEESEIFPALEALSTEQTQTLLARMDALRARSARG